MYNEDMELRFEEYVETTNYLIDKEILQKNLKEMEERRSKTIDEVLTDMRKDMHNRLFIHYL